MKNLKTFLIIKILFFAISIFAFNSCGQQVARVEPKKAPQKVQKKVEQKVLAKTKTKTKTVAKAKTVQPAPKKSSFFPAQPSSSTIAKASSLSKDRHGLPKYSTGTRNRYVRTTAYSHMEKEPGAPGRLNAAGTTLKYGNVRSAAADWSVYPVGTLFKIKGLPHTYVVDDYGSALVGAGSIDIFHPSLYQMRKWNTRNVEIDIVKMGSWERSAKLLKGRTKYKHCARMYAGVRKQLRKSGGSRTASTN